MTNENHGKYIVSKNNKNYYYNSDSRELNSKLKSKIFKIANPLVETSLRFKRIDRVMLKSVNSLAGKLNLDREKVLDSKMGKLYRNINYRARYQNQARKYIPNELGIEGFFKELNKRNINYVILRWFEELPQWPEGEDIDILMKDEDMDRIIDLFNTKPEGTPVDTYTVNGRKGCSFGIAGSYYPPVLGERILNNKTLFKDTFYIPNEKYHFLSLLYHIVYHKAEKSGLPLSEKLGKQYDEVDHDYKTVINAFQEAKELEGNINLTALHTYLEKNDFIPNIDTLRKLCMKEKSEFLFDLAKLADGKGIEPYDIIVFFIREWAFKEDKVLNIIDTIVDHDLEIMSYYYLENEAEECVSKNVRGGNWSRGPYPASGGIPKLAIITFDKQPKRVTFDLNDSHPFVSNENVFIKGKVRDKINDQMLATKWVNSLHSSDDFTEAKEYIDIIDPELYEVVKKRIDNRINEQHISKSIPQNSPLNVF